MTWFVAYTGVRQERRAAASLADQGFEVFVPLEKHLRSHARVKDTVERPMVPRYLFFKLSGRSFYDVRNTDGIDYIIGGGAFGAPTPMPVKMDEQGNPTTWVDTLRKAQEAGAFDYTRGLGLSFDVGEAVMISCGPFAGQLATIMEAKPGAKRVRVFLKVLGRLTDKPTQINVLDVQKVMAA